MSAARAASDRCRPGGGVRRVRRGVLGCRGRASLAPRPGPDRRRKRGSDGRQRLGEFDIITAFDIIEHTRDPVAFLGELRELLRPGGSLLLTTPDVLHPLRWLMGARWPMLQPLQHTFLFSRLSMRMALERAGFTLARIDRATKCLTPEYLASQIEGHNPRLWRLYRALSRVIPQRIRHRAVNVNIGEMLVLARRPA